MQQVLDEQLWMRFEALRAAVVDYVRKKVKDGAYHKSYEGRLEISFCFPSYFEDPELVEEPYVNICLSCSLLLPTREVNWNASRFDWALAAAEKDIYALIEG